MIDDEDVLKTAKDGSRNRAASHAEDSGRHQDGTKEPENGGKGSIVLMHKFKRRITA